MSIKQLMNDSSSLPFSKKKQEAVLGHLLTNNNFFFLCRDRIKPEWFNQDAVNQKLWSALQNFWTEYQRYPEGESEFLEFPDISCQDQLTRNRLNQQYKICVNESLHHGLDTIKPMLEEWLQTQIYMKYMSKSSVQFNKGDVSEAFKIAKEGTREIEEVKFTPDEEVDFEQWYIRAEEDKKELNNALTFGISSVDKLLTPQAASGGLLRGDTTVLLAATNVGKTTAMISVACANIKLGKDILFFTHEGRNNDLEKKMLKCMAKLNEHEWARALSNPEKLAEIHYNAMLLKQHMIWVPLTKPGYTVEELDGVINRRVDQWMQKNGKGFDMLVDDYPALLFTNQNAKGMLAKRHQDDIVYSFFTRWALSWKFHSFVAIQGNRESSKVNRKLKESETRLLTVEDVAESFAPMQSATNVITVNRDPESMRKGIVTFYICKSRSSETGWAIMCNSDYARACTHSNELGSTWYRGAATMTDRVDDLLGQYKNQMVPDAYIFNGNKAG